MSVLGEHFGADASNYSPEELRRRLLFRKQREFRIEAEFIADQKDGNVKAFAASTAALATPIELEEFSAELNILDVATISAILHNQEILQRLYRERDAMLDNAYMLEDGTRVFKSEDGARVFDEHGDLVSDEVIHPDEIPDHHTKAEPYLNILSGIKKHKAIESELIAYQEKLDEARQRVDSREMTKQELEKYKVNLQRDMPIEVKRQLPDYDPANEQILKSDFTASSKTSQLTAADMRIDPSMVPQ